MQELTPNTDVNAPIVVGPGEVDLNRLRRLMLDIVGRLYAFRLLLAVFVLLAVVWWVAYYALSPAVYTAEVVIGPPTPSPVNSMLSSMGGGLTSGKLLGAFSSNNTYTPYDQFQQVVVSDRLVLELAETKGFLQSIFPSSWDEKTNTWKQPGALHNFSSAIKKFMHRPVVDHPDAEMLSAHLARNLHIQPIKKAGSALSTLGALDSKFVSITYSSGSPEAAERILTTIINKADSAIRKDLLVDVDARIAFLRSELQHVAANEQREALINILTNQEEIRAMLVADKCFSYQVVSTPHASSTPTTPVSPVKGLLINLIVAGVLWAGLVLLQRRVVSLQRVLSKFKRP